MFPKYRFLVFLAVLLLLSGCAPSVETSAPSGNWKIALESVEIKASLQTSEAVTQYTGMKMDVTHQQLPDSGNVYLLVNLVIQKVGNSPEMFKWEELHVQDAAGSLYPRHANDTFLEEHNYSPRITGLDLRLGEVQGWICFEIPDAAANGSLVLRYSGEGSLQSLTLKK